MRNTTGGRALGVRLGASFALAIPAIAIAAVLGGTAANATPAPPPGSPSVSVSPETTASPDTSTSPDASASASPEPSGSASPDASTSPEPEPSALPPIDGSGSIRGKVWNDANKNGVQDAGEQGVPNINILLFRTDDAGNESDDKTRDGYTNAKGEYFFTNVKGGYWGVVIPLDSPWKFTKPEVAGADCLKNSDVFVQAEGDIYPDTKPCTDYESLDVGAASSSRAANETFTTAAQSRPLVLRNGKVITIDAGIYGGTVAAPSATTGTGGNGDPELPVTGAAIGGVIGAGALLLGGGAALMFAARRRRSAL